MNWRLYDACSGCECNCKTSCVTVIRVTTIVCVSQLFQAFLHALLTVYRLWKLGSDGTAKCNRKMKYAISAAIAAMELIGHHSGVSVHFAKAHDLVHILDDFQLFGSCDIYSTGQY